MAINNVVLVGNLVRDIDLKFTAAGVAFGRGTIAVQRDFKNGNGEYESDFISFVVFKNTAEALANNTNKGSRVGLTGRIQTGSYTKEDGNKVFTTDVLVNSFQFLEAKKEQQPHQQQQLQYNAQEINDSLPF